MLYVYPMKKPQIAKLSLDDLMTGIPSLSPGVAISYAEAGAVCLDGQGHAIGIEMDVKGSYAKRFSLDWPEVTEQMKNSWHDDQVATENGACGVALLLVKELTDYSFVQRSRKSTGFDYWLGSTNNSLFQNMARLEVSGIRSGGENLISGRKNIKTKQIDKSNTHLPGFVVIVEFGVPVSHVVKTDGN